LALRFKGASEKLRSARAIEDRLQGFNCYELQRKLHLAGIYKTFSGSAKTRTARIQHAAILVEKRLRELGPLGLRPRNPLNCTGESLREDEAGQGAESRKNQCCEASCGISGESRTRISCAIVGVYGAVCSGMGPPGSVPAGSGLEIWCIGSRGAKFSG